MKKFALLALTLPLALAAMPTPADACGGAIFQERFIKPKPTPPQLVAKGEKSLEEGSAADAMKSAKSAYAKLASLKPGKDAVANRALRLAALAAVRSGGEQGAEAAPTTKTRDAWGDTVVKTQPMPQTAEAKSARLAWALDTLRALNTQSPDNPTLEADLGEALATVPGHEAEAFERLSKLAEGDLLGSPTAYAALAKLRAQQGLTKKSVEAIERCKQMTRTPAMCGPDLTTAPNPA